ncbi:MAG: hypothetical protein ACLT69_13190 [Intestinibacter bartlettii]
MVSLCETIVSSRNYINCKNRKVEGTNTVSSDQIKTTQQLAVTYGEIIESRNFFEDVIKNLPKESYGSLSSKISVSTVTDTQIMKVSVQTQIMICTENTK